jgi:hypothetical protein
MLDLPSTEHWPAHILARTFPRRELCEAIAYLELVRTGKWMPGPEIDRLGIDPLTYTNEELEAVQRRLALAILRQDLILTGSTYSLTVTIDSAVAKAA